MQENIIGHETLFSEDLTEEAFSNTRDEEILVFPEKKVNFFISFIYFG